MSADDLTEAARALLRTATRPAVDSATAQVNAAALDRLRAAVDASTPIVAAEIAAAEQGGAERALREAADDMEGGDHHCFRPQGCVECGRQAERDGRVRWLRDRADRIGGAR